MSAISGGIPNSNVSNGASRLASYNMEYEDSAPPDWAQSEQTHSKATHSKILENAEEQQTEPESSEVVVHAKTLTGSCISVRGDVFEPIKNLKERIIRYEKGFPKNMLCLLALPGQAVILDDEKCLNDYSISQECNLDIVTTQNSQIIRVHIQGHASETQGSQLTSIDAKQTDTIRQLKHLVMKKLNVGTENPRDYMLYSPENYLILDEGRPLSYYSIQHESVIHLASHREPRTHQICVEDANNGQTMVFQLDQNDTVLSVKAEICERLEIAVDGQMLMLGELELQNNVKFSDLCLQNYATIQLLSSSSSKAGQKVKLLTQQVNALKIKNKNLKKAALQDDLTKQKLTAKIFEYNAKIQDLKIKQKTCMKSVVDEVSTFQNEMDQKRNELEKEVSRLKAQNERIDALEERNRNTIDRHLEMEMEHDILKRKYEIALTKVREKSPKMSGMDAETKRELDALRKSKKSFETQKTKIKKIMKEINATCGNQSPLLLSDQKKLLAQANALSKSLRGD